MPTSDLLKELVAVPDVLRDEAWVPRELVRRIRANVEQVLDETTTYFDRDRELAKVLAVSLLEQAIEVDGFSRELRDDERADLEALERKFAVPADSRFANVLTAAYIVGVVVAFNRMGWWGLSIAVVGLLAVVAAWALRVSGRYQRRVRAPIAAFLVSRRLSILAILPLLGQGGSGFPVLESFRHQLDRDGPLLVITALVAAEPTEQS